MLSINSSRSCTRIFYDTIDGTLGSDGIGAIAPAEARRADSDVVSAVTGM